MRCLAGAGPARAASLARSGLSAATGFLLVVAGLLALPLQAQAQTAITLVSNTGQTSDASGRYVGVLGDLQFTQAQQFTTGANGAGYTLSEVVVNILSGISSADVPRVSIYSRSAGHPGTSLYTLTNPASLANGDLTFTAPANATLTKETDYYVVFESPVGTYYVNSTASDSEDTAESRWSIADRTDFKSSDSEPWFSNDPALLISIKGTLLDNETTTSTDATLSALAVNDGTTDHTIDLASTPYTLDVGNAVTTVTLTATPTHTGASVSAVTLGGTAIADTVFTDGITVPSLVEGANVIVVTVTAEDTSTEKTYTVTVTRAALPPPGNCASGAVWCTTMTVASVLFGNARGFRSSMDYAGVGDGGALDSESFTTGGVDYRVKQLYVGFNLEFELSAGLSSYVDHTLEIAGESARGDPRVPSQGCRASSL